MKKAVRHSSSIGPPGCRIACGLRGVVWPDSLSEQLVDWAGLQQRVCCLTAQ